jgi:hypothetical protein
MALKSTIYKVILSIADIDHNYYADHALTLARHPSETDERMMIRLLALAINAYKLQAVCHGDGDLGAGDWDADDLESARRRVGASGDGRSAQSRRADRLDCVLALGAGFSISELLSRHHPDLGFWCWPWLVPDHGLC